MSHELRDRKGRKDKTEQSDPNIKYAIFLTLVLNLSKDSRTFVSAHMYTRSTFNCFSELRMLLASNTLPCLYF